MAIKWTLEGALIYCAMSAYLLAAIWHFRGSRTIGWSLYALGFIVAAGAFGARWVRVEHVPLRNLYEVFIFSGMMIFPVSVFCRRFLGVGGIGADCVVGCLVLFPSGFAVADTPGRLMPALQSPLFAPHVSAYMISYMIMFKAGVQALGRLVLGPGGRAGRLVPREQATYHLVRLGFPLLTLGLVLGAVWAKLAWTDYWNWDPKELWSLASWLIFVGYLHFRHLYGRSYPRASSAIALLGVVAIIVTLSWVSLGEIFKGLHSYA